MNHQTYPTTDGADLRAARDSAGVTQDEVAAHYATPTTRQRLSRLERAGRAVKYVEATAYRAALDAAVAAKVGQVA